MRTKNFIVFVQFLLFSAFFSITPLFAQVTQPGYYIFTSNDIQTSGALDAFIAHKQSKGFNVQVLTQSAWDNTTGDAAANLIRQYLQAHYLSEKIQYVLFVGDSDPVNGIVPMKSLSTPPVPSDYFFADLTGNWDNDGDGIYGEFSQDFSTGGINLYAEVIVGRLPLKSTDQIRDVLSKFIDYENGTIGGLWTRDVQLSLNAFNDTTPNWQFGASIDSILSLVPDFTIRKIYDNVLGFIGPPQTTPADIIPCNYNNVVTSWRQNRGYHVWTAACSSFNQASETCNHFTYRLSDGNIETVEDTPPVTGEFPSFVFGIQPSAGNPTYDEAVPWSSSICVELLQRNDVVGNICSTADISYISGASHDSPMTYNNSSALGLAYRFTQRLFRDSMSFGDALYDTKLNFLRSEGSSMWQNVLAFNLYGDPSMYYYDLEPKIQGEPVIWTNTAGVEIGGSILKKTAADGWGNAGAESQQSIVGDGWVRFTTEETSSHRVVGLSPTNPDNNFNSIKYGIFVRNDGTFIIYENGTRISPPGEDNFGSYSKRDYFSIERIGSTVYYKRNGTTFHASTVESTEPLIVDAAVNTRNGLISDAWISGNGPQLSRNRAPIAYSQAVSSEINIPSPITLKSFDSDNDLLTYEIVTQPAHGQLVGVNPSKPTLKYVPNENYIGNDSFSFRVHDGEFYSNTSEVKLQTHQHSVPVIWKNLVSSTFSENIVYKHQGADGWNTSGASSTQIIEGDGALLFKAKETHTNRMVGFSDEDLDTNYTTINYAYYLRNDGRLIIFENGTRVPATGDFGIYNEGDTFSIERMGEAVNYYHNSELIHTSLTPSVGPLLADCAFYTVRASIFDAQIIGSSLPADSAPVTYSDIKEGYIDITNYFILDGASTDDSLFNYRVIDEPFHVREDLDESNLPVVVYKPQLGYYGFDRINFDITNGVLNSNASRVAILINAEPVVWTNPRGVHITGNTLIKEFLDGWGNAGAHSEQILENQGTAIFKAMDNFSNKMLAFSKTTNRDTDYRTMAYAIFANANGRVVIFENGIRIGNPQGGTDFGAYNPGDFFSIERTGNGEIIYRRNNDLLMPVRTVNDLDPLIVDASIYSKSASIGNAYLVRGDTPPPVFFSRGNANCDTDIDISDAIFILLYLFVGNVTPSCADATDANDDGVTDIADPILILGSLFRSTPENPILISPPVYPPGADLTPDALSCEMTCPIVR